jgi:hypothetical protein
LRLEYRASFCCIDLTTSTLPCPAASPLSAVALVVNLLLIHLKLLSLRAALVSTVSLSGFAMSFKHIRR